MIEILISYKINLETMVKIFTSFSMQCNSLQVNLFANWSYNISELYSRDRPIWLFWGRYRYIGLRWADIAADTDISKIFKSCFLLHYQKYVFYALPFFQNLKKSGFIS